MIARRSRKRRAEIAKQLRSISAMLRLLPVEKRAAAAQELVWTARAFVAAVQTPVAFKD